MANWKGTNLHIRKFLLAGCSCEKVGFNLAVILWGTWWRTDLLSRFVRLCQEVTISSFFWKVGARRRGMRFHAHSTLPRLVPAFRMSPLRLTLDSIQRISARRAETARDWDLQQTLPKVIKYWKLLMRTHYGTTHSAKFWNIRWGGCWEVVSQMSVIFGCLGSSFKTSNLRFGHNAKRQELPRHQEADHPYARENQRVDAARFDHLRISSR